MSSVGNSLLRILPPLLGAGLLSLALLAIPLDPVGADMEKLSEASMSTVTGKEGLAVDLNVNAQIDDLEISDGGGAFFVAEGITFDNGSGGQANLNNMTINASSGNGLSVGAPSGNFTADFNIFCFDDLSSAPSCDGSVGGADEAFGRLEAQGISLDGSEWVFQGRGEGLSGEFTVNYLADAIRYYDRNGEANNQNSGSAGVLELGGFEIGYRGGAFAPTLTNDLEVDVNSNGLVINPPSQGPPSNSNFLDVEVDDVYAGDPSSNPPGTSMGRFWIERFTTTAPGGNESQFEVEPNGDGVTINADLFFDAHRIAWQNENENAIAQLGAVGGGGEFRIHDGSNNPISFSGLDIGINGDEELLVDFPTIEADIDIPHLDLGNDNRGAEIYFDGFDLDYTSDLQIVGSGEGAIGDLDLEIDIDNIDLRDNDGLSGSAGVVRFGHSSNIDIGSGAFGTANLTGMTLDVDPSRGVILGLPEGDFGIDIENLVVGSGLGTSFTPGNSGDNASMGDIDVSDINFGSNSEVAFQGAGDGLDLGLQLDVDMDAEISDDDGWDGGSEFSGELHAENLQITVDDGSGSLNSPGGPAEVSVALDSSQGTRIQADNATINADAGTIFLGDSSLDSEISPVDASLDVSGSAVSVFSR